ncbi:MAG: hypothetical protein PVJ86_14290 [Phycisphaerales bacterium]
MKKLTSSKTMLALALLVVSGLALAAGREPMTISGQVTLAPQPPFSGAATVTIGDETLSGDVMVVPLAAPVPKDGGLYFPVVEHWFTLEEENTLITTGEEFIMPTNEDPTVSTLHGNMTIIQQSADPEGPSATGTFEGASGELRVSGKFNSPPGKATFEARGVISR